MSACCGRCCSAALGYTLVFAAIVVARTRAAVMERRIRALLMARADRGRGVTHLPYIVAAYALGVLIPGTFAVAAFLRMAHRAAAAGRNSTPGSGGREASRR